MKVLSCTSPQPIMAQGSVPEDMSISQPNVLHMVCVPGSLVKKPFPSTLVVCQSWAGSNGCKAVRRW